MENSGSSPLNLPPTKLLTPMQKGLGIAVPLIALLALAALQVAMGTFPPTAAALASALLALTALAVICWPASAGRRHLRSALVGWLRAFFWLTMFGAPVLLFIIYGAVAASDFMTRLTAGLSCLAIIGPVVATAPIVQDRALREALPQAPQTLGAAALVVLLIAIAGSL